MPDKSAALALAATTLRARLRSISQLRRLRMCGVVKCRAELGVWVSGAEGKRKAHACGVLVCGSVHVCPSCARRIRARRMVQLSAALRGGLEACPERAWQMLSITFRHHAGMRLRWLRDCLMRAWRRCRQNGYVQAVWKNRVRGSARAFEVTHGAEHGWHPHLHIAILTSSWTEREKLLLRDTFLRCFAAEACEKTKGLVEKKKRNGETRLTHDVIAWDVDSYRKWLAFFTEYSAHAIRWSDRTLSRGDSSQALQAYLTDIGLELSLGSTKTTHAESSRTPWQIAEQAVRGDARATRLWWEYEDATKGTRCIELDDRAAAFATSTVAMAPETREPGADDDVELSEDVSFEGAPVVGTEACYAELDPEMFGIVRDYERHVDARATLLWLEAAASTRGPLTAASIRESVDACLRGMVECLRALKDAAA